MNSSVFFNINWYSVLSGFLFLGSTSYLSTQNFLLFHILIEGFTIVISATIALIVYNNYQYIKNTFISIIGITYAFAGIFDVFHTLIYEGMGVFPNATSDPAPQFWIIARYLDSTGMLLAGLSYKIKIKPRYVFTGYAIISAASLLALYLDIFPVCFIDGQGLTSFKIYSEYVIAVTLIASIFLLIRHKNHFSPDVYQLLLLFYLTSICTELSFTVYKASVGISPVVGHSFKAIGFYFLYRAVIITNLTEPYKKLILANTNLERISDGFFAVDNEWRLTYVNPVASNIAFNTTDKLLGKVLWDITASAQPFYTQYHRAKRENIAVHFDAKAARSGKWVEVHAYPSPEGLSVLFRDITEKKDYEANIARLEKLNIIGEMAASIGHEIRNPLTTVKGYLQMFQRKKMYAEHQEQFTTMLEELDRANLILSEFLSLAKNKTIDFKTANLNNIITSLLPLVEADALHSGHKLQVELNDIPTFAMDEKEIRQVLLNLVRNGIEATPSGGTVTIKTTFSNHQITLAVQDTGCGIPEDVLARIGTPFLTTKTNGTGLGLPVCFRIAEHHNAKINILTGSNGTTFLVKFNLD